MGRGEVITLPPTTIGFLTIVLGIVSFAFLKPALENRDKPGSRSFAFFIVVVGLYAIFTGINILSADLIVSIWANKAILSNGVLIGVGWLLLGTEISARVTMSRRLITGIGIYAVIAVFLIWVNPSHVVIGSDAHMQGTYLVHTEGIWYSATVVITFLSVVTGTGLLAIESTQSTGLRRKQTALLTFGIIPTVAGGVLTAYLLSVSDGLPYDYTVFGYTLTGVIFGVTLYETRFLDITPVARRIAVGEMRDAMITIDDENRVVDCNQSARELFGVGDDWAGMSAANFFSPVSTDGPSAFWNESNSDTEVAATIRGEQRYFSLSVTPVGDRSNGRVILLHEITARKRHERELQEFKEAVEHAGYGIMITDSNGVITFVNPAMEAQTGYTAEELIGRTPRILNSGEQDGEFFQTLWETILDGQVWEGEIVNERKNGDRYTVNQTIAPITDAGEILAFVSVNHDITERKEYEQRIEDQRDGLDLLNQILCHDIRNDLQMILARTEMLEQEFEDDPVGHTDQIVDSARNAVDLTEEARQLVEVMVQSETAYEAVPLRQMLTESVERVQDSVENAVVVVNGPIPDTRVRADEMLSSVFRNLLKNAVQHNDEDIPEITVSVIDDEDHVKVRIADNGPGVPDAQKPTVFGKGERGLESEGTGIGLYLVNTLVESYGGDVWVEDNEPKGAIFIVSLPKSNGF